VKALDRHSLDAVARAVVSGRRGHGQRIDRLADFVAGLMPSRLAALGAGRAKPKRSNREPPPVPAALRNPRTLETLLRRVQKHLEQKAMAEALRGGPAAR
jgi:hypothetical protein